MLKYLVHEVLVSIFYYLYHPSLQSVVLVWCAAISHANVHWCTFSCIPGMMYTWLMHTDELL